MGRDQRISIQSFRAQVFVRSKKGVRFTIRLLGLLWTDCATHNRKDSRNGHGVQGGLQLGEYHGAISCG